MAGPGSQIAPTRGRWRRRRAAGAPPSWFGIVFALVGLAAIGFGVAGAIESRRLDAEGVTVQGRIVNRSTGTDSDGNRIYRVMYEFVDPATGAAHRRSTNVTSSFYARSREGDAVTITYLPSDPGTSRLGSPPFASVGGLLAVVAFGSVFVLVGGGLAYGGFRARRRPAATPALEPVAPQSSGLPAGLAGAIVDVSPAERARIDQFTRSAGRAILDALLPPIAGAGFLTMTLFLLGQAGRDPALLLFALVAGFFGALLLSGVPAALRRGLGRRLLTVGQDGIDHRDYGFLRWDEIAEVRVERNIGSGGEGLAAYLRLGIVPRDPAVAAAVPGGLTRGLAGAFARFANKAARSRGMRGQMTEVDQIAPLGVYAYELEQRFEDLVASVRRFAPVVDAAVARAAAAEPERAPAVAPTPGRGTVTPEELRELDALLGRPSAVMATADLGSIIAPSPPVAGPATSVEAPPAGSQAAERPRTQTFYRRGANADSLGGVGAVTLVGSALSQLWSATFSVVFIVFPLLFVANGLTLLARGDIVSGLLFVVLPLSLSLLGLGQLFGDLARWPLLTGEPDLLRVGPEGITVKGLGHLRWPEVAELSADDDTLTIRATAEAALPDRFWAAGLRDRYLGVLRRILPFGSQTRRSHALDFALLEADRDEVLDAIAAHRVVTEG